MAEGWLSSGGFAARAGVTVRTLRYYDRLGLLTPGTRRRDGRRGYGTQELVRLQQILTLKFLGFSLAEIGEILDNPRFDLARALHSQRQQVEARMTRLREIAQAIDRAHDSLTPGAIDWESFLGVIKAIQMEHEREEWIREHYTEEQLAQLKARPFSAEDQARVQAEWTVLYAEVQALADAGADPAGPDAQALATRFQALIDQFTGGDKAIEASLNRMYADREKIPADMRMGNEKTGPFVGAMLAAYHAKQG